MGTTDLALVGPTAGRQAGGGVVLGHVALQEVLVGIMGRLPLRLVGVYVEVVGKRPRLAELDDPSLRKAGGLIDVCLSTPWALARVLHGSFCS